MNRGMKEFCAVLLFFMFSSAMPPLSAQDDTDAEQNLAVRVMHTIYTGNLIDYADMQAHLLNAGSSLDREYFWASFLAYKIASIYQNDGDRKTQKSAVSDCRKLVDEIEESSMYYARAQAIKSLCLGHSIAMSPMKGIWLGAKADDAKQQALEHESSDIFVLLLAAVSDYYTPEGWGGSPERAQQRLLRVIAEVKRDRAPAWLLPEAYAFLALIYERLNQREQALEALAEARELAPNYHLLIYVASRL